MEEIKLLTFNMQGYGDGKIDYLIALLQSRKYGVLCIQEAGTPLNSFKEINPGSDDDIKVMALPTSMRSTRMTAISKYIAFYYEFGEENNRCSMVTYVDRDLINYSDSSNYMSVCVEDMMETRPMLFVILKNGLFVGNIHLISGNQSGAKRQFEIFDEYLNGTDRPYLIAGDTNINLLASTNVQFKKKHDKRIVSTYSKTQKSGGCLDYLIFGNMNIVKAECNALNDRFIHSDHLPVEYCISYIESY